MGTPKFIASWSEMPVAGRGGGGGPNAQVTFGIRADLWSSEALTHGV